MGLCTSFTQNLFTYQEKMFIRKFKDISSQVLNNFFLASDIMEAVRGCQRLSEAVSVSIGMN